MVQELAFTPYDGLTYVEAAVKAGLPWTGLLRSFRSFSMPTATSLKRLPSSGQPADCGHMK